MASELETLTAIEAHGDLNPVQRTTLENLRKAQGITSGGNDYASIIAQQQEAMRKANEPAIQSLTASIPEITSKYEQERTRLSAQQTPLEQRYQNLLSDI